MDNLLQALINADRICNEAQVYFDKGGEIEAQKQALLASIKQLKVRQIIFGVIGYFIVAPIAGLVLKIPVIGIVGCALPVIVIAWCVMKYRSGKANIQKEAEALQRQYEAEYQKGQRIFEANIDTLNILPIDYWYPTATNFMIKALQSGRAKTLPEAIDKFEEQMHRWKVEQANAQILSLQQSQSEQLSRIMHEIQTRG